MTRRTTPNSPETARGEDNQRRMNLQESSYNRNESNNPNESRYEDRETVNLQRSSEEEYDIGERRPSGRKGEMTNSDEIY